MDEIDVEMYLSIFTCIQTVPVGLNKFERERSISSQLSYAGNHFIKSV